MAASQQAELNRRAEATAAVWQRKLEMTGALLVSSCAVIDESRRLLTTILAKKTDRLAVSGRAAIDESRELLATVQGADLQPTPVRNSPPEPVTNTRSDGASLSPALHQSDPAFIADGRFSPSLLRHLW